MAWRRSGLSLLAVGAAIARGLPNRVGVPGHPVLGGVVLVVGGLFVLVSTRAAVRRASHVGERPAAAMGDLAPMAVGAALVAVAASIIILLGH